jgi:Asp-tRNA(Asn)/Glu-tRNA(Gln) amidotransferase A subunit family amidase
MLPIQEYSRFDALGLADLIRRREASPEEVLEAALTRSGEVNGRINAIVVPMFEEAQARVRAGLPSGPFTGVPYLLKDLGIYYTGFRTTAGCRFNKDYVADHDSELTRRYKEAGLVIFGKAASPEFGLTTSTESALFGATRNPWNLERVAGGSSGGSAAAVAAGILPAAHATDGGGSIRIPASANGIVGYKPPFGRNPLDHEHPGETVLHYGPLTRTVADAALMQNVMSGPHSADIYSLRDTVELPAQFEDLSGWRVALSMDLGYVEVSDTVQENTRRAAEAFTELGCTVDEVELGWDERVLEAWLTNWEGIFWALMKDMVSRWRFQMDPFVVKILEAGSRRSVPEFYGVQRTRYDMYQKLAPILETHDILICPTLAVPAVKADHANDDPGFEINGRPVHPYVGWILTYPFNVVSQCPVASVPSGFCPETGVPTGLQIVGKTFDDLSVFRAAAAFEQARPWSGTHPPLGSEAHAAAVA